MSLPFWHPKPAPPEPFKGQLFPEGYANPLSRFLFHWAGAILKVGYSRPLMEDDLYELPPELVARNLADKLEAEFAKRLPPSRQPPQYQSHTEPTESTSDTTPLLAQESTGLHNDLDPAIVIKFGKRTAKLAAKGDLAIEGGKLYDMSLWRAMHNVVKGTFWGLVLIDGFGQYLCITAPLLTRQILWEITTTHALHEARMQGLPTQDLPKPHSVWAGIGLAVLFFFWLSVGNLCQWTSSSHCQLLALIDLISRKSMRLSPKSRLEYTNGKLTTLVSTDSSSMENNLVFIVRLFTMPPQVAIGIALLFWTLGPVSFVGAAVLALSGSSQALLFTRLRKIQVKQEEAVDNRTRLMCQIIANIRAVKLYAWESFFGQKIGDLRAKEIGYLRRHALIRAIITSFSSLTPVAAATVTFVTYALLGNKLQALPVFTALHLFNTLQVPLMVIPRAYGVAVDISVAMERVQKMLAAEELKHRFILDRHAKFAVDVEGEFEFEVVSPPHQNHEEDTEGLPSSTVNSPVPVKPFALRNISLQIPAGALVCIVGRVGTGKTALLSGMINEVRQSKGHVIFNAPVCYVPQQAWVQSGTVRENITFSSSTDNINMQKLSEVIKACALQPDLDSWVNNDLTMIGERGITLSGGQRQRICLARAAYSDGNIVLLDDPLSAVDANVGHYLLANCILAGPLASRTRLFVTHNLEVLPSADLIIVMDHDKNGDGYIVQQGTYPELSSSSGIFQTLIHDFGSTSTLDDQSSLVFDIDNMEDKGKGDTNNATGATEAGKPVGKLMIEEERNVGSIPWSCYTYYLRSVKSWTLVYFTMLAFVAQQGASVAVPWWLGMWSGRHVSLAPWQIMAVYAALGLMFAVMMTVTYFGTLYSATQASITIFNGALNGVMRTYVGWHDRTPTGRIINRLTKDIANLDTTVGERFFYFAYYTLHLFGGLFLVAYTYPILTLLFIPIVIINYLGLVFYRETGREIKRLDSNLRSHIYASFSEQLSGLTVIRAFGKQAAYERQIQEALYSENRAHILTFFTSRWIGAKLELSAQLIVMLVAIFGVTFATEVDAARFGVVLTYMVASTSALSMIVAATSNLEVDMNNVERIKHYHEIEAESAGVDTFTPPASWPSEGSVTFSDVCLRYRPDLPMILQQISFSIKPGEKVGVIGRTGAGKSSLAQALFRTVDLCSGVIMVDGINLANISLASLRSNLGIIPQEAFLFGGTVRDNLDPGGVHTDQELNQVLSLIHQDSSASASLQDKFLLDAQVQDGGANFSAGEQQLLALMRALVRKNRVLLMDEATSSVDLETDALIQRIIQTSFGNTTLISIAHRLQTVAGYDRILVMDHGKVVEFDSPLALFDQNGSIFRALCEKQKLSREHVLKMSKQA